MPNFPWYIWAALGALFIMFVFPLILSLLGSVMGRAQGSKQGA